MRMPFGKHKGKDLRNVPREYLEWLLIGTKEPINPYLAEAIKEVFAVWDLKKEPPKKHYQKRNPKPKHDKKIDAAEWLLRDCNVEDYQIALTHPDTLEMAKAAERLRQRWEGR